MVLKYVEYGDQANQLMVMIHGWPDTPAIWRKQVDHFKDRYHVVCIQLPCFGDGDTQSSPTFCQLLDSFDATVDQLLRTNTNNDVDQRGIVLMAHDWGTTLAYLYERRYGASRVHRLVTLDIGPNPKPTISEKLKVISYQWPLVFALWLHWYIPVVGSALGSLITTWIARWLGAPGAYDTTYSAAQNFLYHNLWRTIVLGPPKEDHDLKSLPKRFPQVPALFLYSKQIPVQFHSSKWRRHLKESDGSDCIGNPCNHWLQLYEKSNAQIDAFLAAKL